MQKIKGILILIGMFLIVMWGGSLGFDLQKGLKYGQFAEYPGLTNGLQVKERDYNNKFSVGFVNGYSYSVFMSTDESLSINFIDLSSTYIYEYDVYCNGNDLVNETRKTLIASGSSTISTKTQAYYRIINGTGAFSTNIFINGCNQDIGVVGRRGNTLLNTLYNNFNQDGYINNSSNRFIQFFGYRLNNYSKYFVSAGINLTALKSRIDSGGGPITTWSSSTNQVVGSNGGVEVLYFVDKATAPYNSLTDEVWTMSGTNTTSNNICNSDGYCEGSSYFSTPSSYNYTFANILGNYFNYTGSKLVGIGNYLFEYSGAYNCLVRKYSALDDNYITMYSNSNCTLVSNSNLVNKFNYTGSLIPGGGGTTTTSQSSDNGLSCKSFSFYANSDALSDPDLVSLYITGNSIGLDLSNDPNLSEFDKFSLNISQIGLSNNIINSGFLLTNDYNQNLFLGSSIYFSKTIDQFVYFQMNGQSVPNPGLLGSTRQNKIFLDNGLNYGTDIKRNSLCNAYGNYDYIVFNQTNIIQKMTQQNFPNIYQQWVYGYTGDNTYSHIYPILYWDPQGSGSLEYIVFYINKFIIDGSDYYIFNTIYGSTNKSYLEEYATEKIKNQNGIAKNNQGGSIYGTGANDSIGVDCDSDGNGTLGWGESIACIWSSITSMTNMGKSTKDGINQIGTTVSNITGSNDDNGWKNNQVYSGIVKILTDKGGEIVLPEGYTNNPMTNAMIDQFIISNSDNPIWFIFYFMLGILAGMIIIIVIGQWLYK